MARAPPKLNRRTEGAGEASFLPYLALIQVFVPYRAFLFIMFVCMTNYIFLVLKFFMLGH